MPKHIAMLTPLISTFNFVQLHQAASKPGWPYTGGSLERNRSICKTRKERALVRSMGWTAVWLSPEVLADMQGTKEKQSNMTETAASTVRDVSRQNRKNREKMAKQRAERMKQANGSRKN